MVCYAVCDICVNIDDKLRARIKSELVKVMQQHRITTFLNGFDGDNEYEFRDILFEAGFKGKIKKLYRYGWTAEKYDMLMAIENGRTDHIIKLIRTAWRYDTKCSVIWV